MSNSNENLRLLIESVVFSLESKEALVSRESTFCLYGVKVESWKSTQTRWRIDPGDRGVESWWSMHL